MFVVNTRNCIEFSFKNKKKNPDEIIRFEGTAENIYIRVLELIRFVDFDEDDFLGKIR